MWLFAQVGDEEGLGLLVEGWGGCAASRDLAGAGQTLDRPRQGPAWPGTAAGAVRRVARPLATPATKGAWSRDWRLLALDGTTLAVADTRQRGGVRPAWRGPGQGRSRGCGWWG
jgi:hypothetical protein